MDQAKNAGHHAITREAVRQFFQAKAVDGKVNGMTEVEYFHALDAAQYDQDVSVSVGGKELPSYGTAVPASVDGDAQRQHGMADPAHGGAYNIDADRGYVEGQLAEAHRDANRSDASAVAHAVWNGNADDTEMRHLGNATHALEDSYSEAHAFRGDAVNSGDPNAPIESFNVWKPEPHKVDGEWRGKFISENEGTHDERFDEVPVAGNPNLDQNFGADPVPLVHGSDRAAAAATAQMLETYEENRQKAAATAEDATHQTVGQFYQPPAGGEPAINRDEGDPAWIAERDRRLKEHEAEDHKDDGGMSVQPEAPAEPNASYPEPTTSEPNQSVQPPEEPSASYQPPEPNQSVQPDPPNQSTQPPEPNASYQPPEPNQSTQPAADPPASSSQPADAGQSTQPAEPNQSTQPAEPNQSTQPAEPNQSTEPAAASSSPDGS